MKFKFMLYARAVRQKIYLNCLTFI